MAKIYYTQIKRGTITVNNVPKKWRAEVEELLKADEKQRG